MTLPEDQSVVTFVHSFVLGGEPYPAGSYTLLSAADRLEGLRFDAWRQTALHMLVTRKGCTEMIAVDAADLARARQDDCRLP